MTARDQHGIRIEGRSLAGAPVAWAPTGLEDFMQVAGYGQHGSPTGRWADATLEQFRRREKAAREALEGVLESNGRFPDETIAAYFARIFAADGSPQARTAMDVLDEYRRASAWLSSAEARAEREARERAQAAQRDRDMRIAGLRRQAEIRMDEIDGLLAVIHDAAAAEQILASLPELIAKHQAAARARAAISSRFSNAASARRMLQGEEFGVLPEKPTIPAPPPDLLHKLQQAAITAAQL